ncbi:MAG: hypothetical protein GEV28_04520 [Actinophytocola sp.]|uniref:hypothetical protein n=1 Tax=Actinophytocola sp. TaxID=1872138 RepID=UPI001322F899|nr:hypothetical protein [Actinophytocola sp.]MPZ79685.1 hypothetical protein [Actinophytocola sp.]
MGSQGPEVDPQIVCALGAPATDADMEWIRQFANVLDATVQAQTLTKELPLREIAELQHNLLSDGAFGPPLGTQWDELDETERRRATRNVYTALVAAIVAGFHVTPAVPHAGETPSEQPGHRGGQSNRQDRSKETATGMGA